MVFNWWVEQGCDSGVRAMGEWSEGMVEYVVCGWSEGGGGVYDM